MLYFTLLKSLVLIPLINGELGAGCPSELNDLELDPPELVVQYGDHVSVRCLSSSSYTDLGWSASMGNVSNPDNKTDMWETDLYDWEIQPVCYMTLDDMECNKTLPLIVYKLPDWVSISPVNHSGPMIKGRPYELQCDIQNVAPGHLLTVNWYKGFELVNSTSFPDFSTKFPANMSTTLQILPSREDHKIDYKCEAKLNLGKQGPQPPPSVTSAPLNIIISGADCPAEHNDLELDPPELVVQYGDPVSVSCRSFSDYTDLDWRVSLGNVSKVDNQTVIWDTDYLSDWEIEPVCYMTLGDMQCDKTLPLIVYKVPDQVSISIVNHIGPMTAGKKYDLQCEIQNFAPVNVLSVSWYKGDTLVRNRAFNELPTKTPSNKTVTLRITASKDEGEAPYSCEAKLKLESRGLQSNPIVKSNLLSVAVHYKPVINCLEWSPLINTPLNSYPHNVTGNPSPNITWYRENSPVNSSMLLSWGDSGQYKYVATNMMGSTSCVTKITVEYPPTFNCFNTYDRKENESFFGECSVMASPKAEVTWEKDGKKVNPLDNLRRGDSGSYVITAMNKHGTVRHDLTVKVLYGPEIHHVRSSEVVKVGTDVSLNCTADGNPEPEVSWSFENQTKTTGRRQATLKITKAESANAGVYTCTATNKVGIDTRTVSLTVEGRNFHRIAIVISIVAILIIFLIIFLYCMYDRNKRTGSYAVQANGTVNMSLLNKNDEQGMNTNTENDT